MPSSNGSIASHIRDAEQRFGSIRPAELTEAQLDRLDLMATSSPREILGRATRTLLKYQYAVRTLERIQYEYSLSEDGLDRAIEHMTGITGKRVLDILS
jgi:hypothetical protein